MLRGSAVLHSYALSSHQAVLKCAHIAQSSTMLQPVSIPRQPAQVRRWLLNNQAVYVRPCTSVCYRRR